MKNCSSCGCLKAPTEFTKRKASKDGLTSSCVDCLRARDRKRGYHGKGSQIVRNKYPNQYKAQNAVNNAIRDGRLAKKLCKVCRASNTHAHHDDYNQPLRVRWLCPIHHKEWHDKNGEALNRV